MHDWFDCFDIKHNKVFKWIRYALMHIMDQRYVSISIFLPIDN